MRQLSDRAIKYLNKLRRSKEEIIERQEIERYFLSKGVPIFEEVVNFGVNYSGFKFNSKKSGDSFSTHLVSTLDIQLNRDFDYEKENDTYLFYCGTHETAQFYFYINQKGQFCSDGYTGANILSSSFDIQIEQYAFKETLLDWVEHPYYYHCDEKKFFENFLTSKFNIINECSDSYNSWYLNNELIIEKGVWLHEASSYLHFYGKSPNATENLINKFIDLEIIIPSK